MAQYVQPGFFSFSMPKWPPAKAEMVAPRPPNEYNSHYLQGTRRPDITTPFPRAGKILPGRRFDLIGPVAAKVSTVKPKDPDLYNRGPFDKLGRMKFESTIPAPIPTSTEYKFLLFKDNAEVNFGDKNDVPPVSIFSNMAPLELVERLIKGVSEPERKEAFEARAQVFNEDGVNQVYKAAYICRGVGILASCKWASSQGFGCIWGRFNAICLTALL